MMSRLPFATTVSVFRLKCCLACSISLLRSIEIWDEPREAWESASRWFGSSSKCTAGESKLAATARDAAANSSCACRSHRLPRSAPPGRTPILARIDIARHRVLVVDDNRDAANSLAMLLTLLGVDAQVVHDGPSALDSLRRVHSRRHALRHRHGRNERLRSGTTNSTAAGVSESHADCRHRLGSTGRSPPFSRGRFQSPFGEAREHRCAESFAAFVTAGRLARA